MKKAIKITPTKIILSIIGGWSLAMLLVSILNAL